MIFIAKGLDIVCKLFLLLIVCKLIKKRATHFAFHDSTKQTLYLGATLLAGLGCGLIVVMVDFTKVFSVILG